MARMRSTQTDKKPQPPISAASNPNDGRPASLADAVTSDDAQLRAPREWFSAKMPHPNVIDDWLFRLGFAQQTGERLPLPTEFQPEALVMQGGVFTAFDEAQIAECVNAWHGREPRKFREYYEDALRIDTHLYSERELEFLEVVKTLMTNALGLKLVVEEQAGKQLLSISKPQNGLALTPEQITFIQGAGNAKKAHQIIEDFQERFGFKITDRTIRKYRN